MSETHFQVIAHYHAVTQEIEDVAGLLDKLTEASRQEEANLAYDYFQSVNDPGHFVILEKYTDAAGFAAHRTYEHFKTMAIGQILPRLKSRTIETYEGRGDA
ncbi:quinol monooxygenase YgiN [Arthrobacter sp. 1088]|uniref:putative quinol monooxygenase n=1 Tax=Arthrobacter sp. 1088 TaxID=2817768 RepID=UPI00285DA7B9|nr:putative quinol monooxygenase [Arthrobacter sp. 1088]MDR6686534.1 quinol monooxygenase YgiN [Arthrobacter sp. 1088]